MSLNDNIISGLDLEDRQMTSNSPTRLKMGANTARATGNDQAILEPQEYLQPSEDAHDPLNWTARKKMAILMTVSATAFIADFGSSIGAVTSVVQSNALCVLFL